MKNYIIVGAVCAILGAVITRYYFPQIDTKVEVQEKEVIKKDIKTVIKEVVRPDGTKEIVTEIIDNSKESKDTKLVAVTYKPKNWVISGTAELKSLQDKPNYGILVQRRFLGPVFVGAKINTEREYGLTIGFEF